MTMKPLNKNKPISKNKKDFIIRNLTKEIKEARKEVKNGNFYDFEKLCKKLNL